MFQNHKELKPSAHLTQIPMDSKATCIATLKELLSQGNKNLRAVSMSEKETHTPGVKRSYFEDDEFNKMLELECQNMELRTADVLSSPLKNPIENQTVQAALMSPMEEESDWRVEKTPNHTLGPDPRSDVEEASESLLCPNSKPIISPLRQVTMEEIRSRFATWHLKQAKKPGIPKILPKSGGSLEGIAHFRKENPFSNQSTPGVLPDKIDLEEELLKNGSTAEVLFPKQAEPSTHRDGINPVDIYAQVAGKGREGQQVIRNVQQTVHFSPPIRKKVNMDHLAAEYDVPKVPTTCPSKEETIRTLVKDCRTHLVSANKMIYLLKQARQSYLDRSNQCPFMNQHIALYPLLIGDGDLCNMQTLIQQGFEACRMHNAPLTNPDVIIEVLRRVFETTFRIKDLLKNYESVITLKGYILKNLEVLNGMADQLSCFSFPRTNSETQF